MSSAGPPTQSATRWAVLVAFTAFALLVSQLRTEREDPSWGHWGRPIIFGVGTDEEAYLVQLNSVVSDFDLNLANNYRGAERGSHEAGVKAAGRGLFHHSTYWLKGERKILSEVRQLGIDPASLGPEYSAHPYGVSFLLLSVLWLVRGHPDAIESLALVCTALAAVVGLLFFRRLALSLGASERAVALAGVGVFLASPVWYYTRGFYNESFILALVVGAYAFALAERPRLFVAGLLVAAAMFMKPQAAVFAAVLAVPMLHARQWRSVAALAVGPMAALGALLLMNQQMFGHVLHGPYPFAYGNFAQGVYVLTLGQDRGLLWYAPAVAVGLYGWVALFKRQRGSAALLLAGALSYFVVTAAWADPGGGWCYAHRLLVPILPLLGLGLCFALDRAPHRAVAWVLLGAVGLGTLYNGLAVINYWTTMGALGSPVRLVKKTVVGHD